LNLQKSLELIKIIEEFKRYLKTEEEKKFHLNYLKEKEPKETKQILEKLKVLDNVTLYKTNKW